MAFDTLTKREREVADAARSGAPTRVLAQQLFVSVRTVETHLGSIYRKLGVSNRAEFVALMLQEQVGTSPPASDAAEGRTGQLVVGAHVLPLPAPLVPAERFVGRSAELELLAEAVAEAKHGGRATVMVGGEPGVGKSAMVAEILRDADGMQVLLGHCDPDIGAPFRPVADAMRPIVQIAGPTLGSVIGPTAGLLRAIWPALAEILPPALPFDDPSTAQRLLVDAIVATLAAAARGVPVVLVLEDLQWADASTLGLVRRLVGEIALSGLALVCTFRNDELNRRHPLPGLLADMWRESTVRRVDLEGLALNETEALVLAATGAHVTTDALRQIQSRTDGNPFFVLQLVNQESLGGISRDTSPLLPRSVHEVVHARATQLGEHAIRLLEAASVLGRDFDVRVLNEMLRTDPAWAGVTCAETPVADVTATTINELIDGNFVRNLPTDPYGCSFVHDLVRESTLEWLSEVERARLHGKAGHAMLTLFREDLDPHLAALAFHFGEAVSDGGPESDREAAASPDDRAAQGKRGQTVAERAARHQEALLAAQFALSAARQAVTRLTLDDAQLFAAQGLKHVPAGSEHDELRLELYIAMVEIQGTLMNLDAHREATLRAIEVARRIGDPTALGRTVDRNPSLPAMGSLDAEILAVKDEALRALGPSPTPLRVRLLASAAYQRTIGGHGWAAAEQAAQAVAEAKTLEDPDGVIAGLHALAAASLGHSDVASQLKVVEELIAAGRHRIDTSPERDGRRFRAILKLAAGDRAGFEADAVRLSAFGELTRSTFVRSLVLEWQTLSALLDGDLPSAEGLASRVLEISGDEPNFLLGWFVQMAWIRIEEGRAAEMMPLAALTLEQHPDLVAIRALVAAIYTEAGALADAKSLIEPLSGSRWAAVPGDWLRPATLAFLAVTAAATLGPDECSNLAAHLRPYAGQLIVVGAGALVWGSADHFRGLLLAAGKGDDPAGASAVLDAAIALEEQVASPALAARSRVETARAILSPGAGAGATPDRGRVIELARSARRDGERLGLARTVHLADEILRSVPPE